MENRRLLLIFLFAFLLFGILSPASGNNKKSFSRAPLTNEVTKTETKEDPDLIPGVFIL